ncbi:DNRLRE domain-containing protein [uncultured Phycicoccus sp.]|uniref:CBM96 family carbohydrate-binding protein n=1 Tax=uncultured Phycicoccus sp. TaxID=661422 RepID=UPI00261A681F|nr:DNRLRE domain-containing protein [uncultured Phycicoccus sp.]
MSRWPTPARPAVAATLAAMLLAFVVPVPASADTSLTFAPTDDATVREDRASTNYGTSPVLEVDGNPRKNAVVRFDVTGVGGGSVTSATLRLYTVDAARVGGDLTAMSDTGWDQDTVTWATAPPGDGANLGSLGRVTVGTWYDVDVTPLVTGDGPVSLRISSTSSNGADYASAEHPSGNAPELVVVVGTPPVPDDDPPTVPQNLEATDVQPSQVSLAWDAATDNIGVTGYDVLRDGAVVDTVTGTSYDDTAVAPSTGYTYRVRARDAAGNTSAPGDPVDVTTPDAPPAGTFVVSRQGSTYEAMSASTTFTGSLKSVVESALAELNGTDGTVRFLAGDFDLGSDHFEISDITDVVIEGAGMGVTTIRNATNEAADTEPFDATRSDRLTIRDLTVSAGGSDRTTSDALDFDGGDDIVIERVEVTDSRGRGIVFDGKDAVSSTGGTAERNVIRDCVVTNVPRDGIQLLAASNNRIENCQISDVGAEGIRLHKASSSASQPNKPSNDNTVVGNTITGATDNGIAVTNGNRNTIRGNTVTGTGRDGIRVFASVSGLGCDDNVVDGNTANGNRYGLIIADAECRRTVVADNDFGGNSDGPILDNGTGTIYTSSDGTPPSAPANLTVTETEATRVSLAWDASTDDVAVTGYDILRDGSLLATVGAVLTYDDTTVAPETSYEYAVRARDGAGNTSDPSTTVPVTTPPGPPVVVVAPSDDATVKESRPTSTYGASQVLEVDASSRKDILLRFDVTGVGGASVTSATLRLYAVDASSVGGTLTGVTDTTWNQNTVTWSTAPAADGATLGSVGPVSAGSWYEVDVSPLVTGDGPVALRITSTSSNGADYASTEHSNGNAPELVVVTSGP